MPRPLSLRVVLPLVTAVVVLAVAALGGALAVRSLRHLGNEQAVARVHSAGLSALREIARAGEEVDLGVRLLAERPARRPVSEAPDREALRQLLDPSAVHGGPDGCALLGAGGPVAVGDLSLPWSGAERDAGAGDGWLVVEGPAGRPPLLVATHALAGLAGWRVGCARWLDARVAGEVSERVGLPVGIVWIDEARSSAGDELAVLRGRAADEGLAGSSRVDAVSAFVDVQPLSGKPGPVVALIETRLGTSVVEGPVRGLVRVFGAAVALAAVVAAAAALLLARRLARPLHELSLASTRIGAGDLDTPIPRAAGSETAVLAEAMEEMRSRLLRLTSELRHGSAEAAAILTGIVEGVWSVDRERRITWINPQAAEGIGIRAEDAIGRFCGDVLNPALPGGGRPCDDSCPILDARFRGNARATEHLVLPDGRQRTVVITSASTTDEAGGDDRESRQFQVLRDETDVEATRRMRDAVLANVSHEFRTPLSAQLASLEMLRDQIEESRDPAVADLVRSMERGTLRLVRLVDNLLESLRIDAGRDSIRRRKIDLDHVVEEAVEQTAPLIEQKGQELDVRLPWPLPALEGDGPRLVQVFTNLLANANKFAPAGSAITVGGEVTPAEVVIWVRDEGPGFPDDEGERRFERFSRAAGEEPEERGLGLGLWIANSIVERHGGRLSARNTDSGAWVAVILPRADQRPGGSVDEDPGG